MTNRNRTIVKLVAVVTLFTGATIAGRAASYSYRPTCAELCQISYRFCGTTPPYLTPDQCRAALANCYASCPR